ncbi:hypothetical protein SD74_19155 [Clostridium botulinum]|nr:hypothetical protein SD74_19155 [Clostridium botulinum]
MTDTDSEIWSSDIEGNSREDVIADGMEYAKEEGLASFRIGQCISVSIPTLDTDSILEDAYDQIYDEVGESAEGFLDDVTSEQEKELEDKLNEVFYNWIKKHKLEPTCYTVINNEIIEVK